MTCGAIAGINPEPWTAPSVSVGRAGGKTFPRVYKSDALRTYQEAIKESLESWPHAPMVGDLNLLILLWRRIEVYKSKTGKTSKRSVADATNMQKSFEDALQGIVFKNDQQIKSVNTVIIEQSEYTEPLIIFAVGDHVPMDEWLFDQYLDVIRINAPDATFNPGEAVIWESDV